MTDKDKKPARRVWKTATQRDLEGAAAARDRARSQGDQIDQLADAVSVDQADDFDEEVDTGITPVMQARIDRDPLLSVLFAKLRHERVRRANQVAEAMGAKPPAEELRSIKWKVNIIWYLLVTVAVAAGGSVFTVAKFLKSSGGDTREHDIAHRTLGVHDGDHEVRLRAVEVTTQQNMLRMSDHLTSHPGRRSDSAWPPSTSLSLPDPDPSPKP